MRSYRHATHLLCALFFAIFSASVASAQWSTQEIVNQIDTQVYVHYLEDLLYTHAGDDRGYGAEHDLARTNIYDTFISFGYDVYLDPFIYNSSTYYNVVAIKTGTVNPEQQYIIGAHYDSVGNPGADDNGSGTAGVMEIARALSQYEFESTILFIGFDREEQGLRGSNAYATEHSSDDILGMVSMDMIAYNSGAGTLDIYGRSASNPLKNALAAATTEYSNGLTPILHGSYDASDHAPFEWQGFQACLFIEDWGNPYYHTANDNVDMQNYLDYEYATKMMRGVCGWLVDSAVVIPDNAYADLISFGLTNGELLDGELVDLTASDDEYVHTLSGYGNTLVDIHNMELYLTAITDVEAPSLLNISIESCINEDVGIAQICLADWTNNSELVQIADYAIGLSDTRVELNPQDATRFVSDNGDITLTIKHIVFMPFLAFQFESFMDHVEIAVE